MGIVNMTDAIRHQDASFEEQGYVGPFSLYSKDQSEWLLEQCAKYPKLLLPWTKGRHTVHPPMAHVGMNPLLLREVTAALGPDLLLWGSQIIRQKPNEQHRWHVDVEHTAWEGVTAWVAAKNVVPGESFSVITRSHRFGITPQELARQQQLDLTDADAVASAARKIDPASKLVNVAVADGQFILFKGRLWHGTRNLTNQNRYAMIFQYTQPDSYIRIPASYHVYPVTAWRGRPECLLVQGRDAAGVNRVRPVEAVGGLGDLLAGAFYHLPKNTIWKADQWLFKQ